MVLVYHVNSQDYVTKEWSNMDGSPSWQVTDLSSLVAISTLVVEI